jgi:hypothetical protein
MGGGSKKEAQKMPPINASSKDEEKFIQYEATLPLISSKSILMRCREFLQSVEQEDKANKISGKEAH